ncbi:unnamed protein product [Lasius platythorax]
MWTFNFYHNIIHVVFPTRYLSDIRIEGFMNIFYRQWVHLQRLTERDDFAAMWGDTQEAREWEDNNPWMFKNIFCLRKFFGLESYEECIPFDSENWDTELESEEPTAKRCQMEYW